MGRHDAHFVTTKAAIYSTDTTHVLAMRLHQKDYIPYGLPGGHVDKGETPDQAIARELDEELGIIVTPLIRKDFFNHANSKIVLAYTGTLPLTTALHPSRPDKETGEWLTKDELTNARIDPGYKTFVLANWPV